MVTITEDTIARLRQAIYDHSEYLYIPGNDGFPLMINVYDVIEIIHHYLITGEDSNNLPHYTQSIREKSQQYFDHILRIYK